MGDSGIKTAFVIMPFAGTTERHTEAYWTRFFTELLKPQLERRKYVCTRSQARPESIVKGILKDLCESDLVVAVLTDFNANVWYELGIRHSLRRGTIMMIEAGQRLPFDIASYGVLVYEDSLAGGPAFEQALDGFLGRIERENPVDSPAQEFLGPIVTAQLEKERHELERKVETLYRATVDRRDAAEPGMAGSPPRILWVDDNPRNNEVIIETYRARGVQFDLALSTDQALRLLDANRNSYSLIISDMGRGSERDAGLQLLSSIKKRYQAPPQVLFYCSTRAIEAYGAKAREMGALEITSSPKSISLLIEKTLTHQASNSAAAG